MAEPNSKSSSCQAMGSALPAAGLGKRRPAMGLRLPVVAGITLTCMVARAQTPAGEFLNEPYRVCEAQGQQYPHSICYNPDRNQYLAAFNDTSGTRWRISYYILDATGTNYSNKITILDDPDLIGTHAAAVTYDSRNQEYLIVYTGWFTESSDRLRSHLVNADGQPIGQNTMIFETPGAMRNQRMAYSPTSDVHLVAWRNNAEVYAVLLSGATGDRTTSIYNLSDGDLRYSDFPTVAWNSARDEFMVIYQVSCEDVNQSVNLFGRRISAQGDVGERFQVTSGAGAESNCDLVYDADLNRYLLAYEDVGYGNWTWGQFLTADGDLAGPAFELFNTNYYGRGAYLSWHPVTREFLIGCLDQNTYYDIGRRISQVGVPLGDPFYISGWTGEQWPGNIGNWEPIPVANTVSNDYLYTWVNCYSRIYSRRYRTLPMSDVTPPAPVTNLVLTPRQRQITLSWTMPATADALGAIVRYKTTGYPTGPHDGEPVAICPTAPGQPASCVHTGLNRATTYYYAVFAYDAIPNHAAPAPISGRPSARADFNCDNDVDQEDFGHLQACLSPAGQPPSPDCADADLNDDGAINQSDVTFFKGCMSGANHPPGC